MDIVISLLLFFVALGVLVSIHEAGHFLSAKIFGVYCDTFSIGFGYKFLRIKKKNWETTFTLGIVPLGGYVSMYGEEETQENKDKNGNVIESPFKNISRKRSLQGVSRIKRIIIMSSGIIMNFVLAFVIFLISASCFPQLTNSYFNVVQIKNEDDLNNSFTNENNELLTIDDKEFLEDSFFNSFNIKFSYGETFNKKEYIVSYTIPSDVSYFDNIENKVLLSFDFTDFGYNDSDYGKYILNVYESSLTYGQDDLDSSLYSDFYYYSNEGWSEIPSNVYFNIPNIDSEGNLIKKELKEGEVCYIKLNFYKDDNSILLLNGKFTVNLNNTFNNIGIGMNTKTSYAGWDSFRIAGDNWVNSTTLVAKSLASLFYSSESWNNVGGPVAIFTQSTAILKNNPFYVYLNTWGTISVNLALFNLLPFPGLDGWQILVEIVEFFVNIFYKKKKEPVKNKESNENEIKEETSLSEVIVKEEREHLPYDDEWHIPSKIKGIVSYIGLGILFLFMIVILFKDIIGLF